MSGMGECAETRAGLGVYVLGAIAPGDRATVVRHLASCGRCREEVAGMAALPALLRKLPAETVAQLTGHGPPPGDSGPVSALQDRLIRQVVRRRYRQWWMTGTAIFVLAAAAGTGWALQLRPPEPGNAAPVAVLESTRIGGVTVLASTQGFTVYWFAPDTATTSACTGNCARRWPPVTGLPAAGPGVTGTLGTITRPDGTIQATYDGHPLYTATVDTAPGQAKGNNLDASGGIWHEVIMTGSAPRPSGPAADPVSGSGGGYGY
jgi:predicted lipoprotein with Yx(FWY)xxD motif